MNLRYLIILAFIDFICLFMEIEFYLSLLKYLDDKIIPKSVREASSTYAVKNYRAMTEGYMVEEGSLYKVGIQISITANNSNYFSKCFNFIH